MINDEIGAGEYDEPHCVVCGCTEDAPCPGGCAWAGETMDGDLVCTGCVETYVERAGRDRQRGRKVIVPGDPEWIPGF